jgi:hypothetical protein
VLTFAGVVGAVGERVEQGSGVTFGRNDRVVGEEVNGDCGVRGLGAFGGSG